MTAAAVQVTWTSTTVIELETPTTSVAGQQASDFAYAVDSKAVSLPSRVARVLLVVVQKVESMADTLVSAAALSYTSFRGSVVSSEVAAEVPMAVETEAETCLHGVGQGLQWR